jgi:hypothetical protein
MSEAIKAALRPEVGGKMSDYIDACVAIEDRECIHRVESAKAETAVVERKIDALAGEVRELRALITSQPDDKYSLTKAKLIKLMKDLGYYE